MNKLVLALAVLIVLMGSAIAQNRGFLGDLDGYIMMTSEDDMLDMDPTLVKSELSLYKNLKWGSLQLQPYYYYKNDSIFANNSYFILNENMVGLDVILQQTALETITTGIGYKYRIKNFGSSDSLLVTRLRMDF